MQTIITDPAFTLAKLNSRTQYNLLANTGALPATDSGRLMGRAAPARRKTTNYKLVSAAEAEARLSARTRGKLGLIPGGLDEPGEERGVVDEPEEAATELLVEEEVTMSDSLEDRMSALDNLEPAPTVAVAEKRVAPADKPRRPKIFVGLESDFGLYTIPVDVAEVTDRGVMLISRKDADTPLFVPKLGARLNLVIDGDSYSCMFPGTVFDINGQTILVLIRDTRGDV